MLHFQTRGLLVI